MLTLGLGLVPAGWALLQLVGGSGEKGSGCLGEAVPSGSRRMRLQRMATGFILVLVEVSWLWLEGHVPVMNCVDSAVSFAVVQYRRYLMSLCVVFVVFFLV